MNFYIKTIKLWFKTHSQPKEYTFEKNKVNVVTGDSSTGKSSILRVIDYCMTARESAIVEDVINENVAWYGLCFHLNGHDYVIARKAPSNGRINSDIYWAPDTDEMPGDKNPRPTTNVSRAEIQAFISKEMNIPEVTLEEGRDKLQPSFREMMMMNYLTEDIIATSGIYFDTHLNTDVRLEPFVLKLMRLGLGADETKEQELQAKKAVLEKRINDEENQKTKDKDHKDLYEKQLGEIRTKAKEIGLIDNDNISQDELLALLKIKIDEFDKLKRSYSKLSGLADLHQKRREINGRLLDYRNLRSEYRRAVQYSKNLESSLRPIEYLAKNLDTSVLGEEAMELYMSLEDAYRQATANHQEEEKLPVGFEVEYDKLRKEEKEVKEKIEECNQIANTFFDPNLLMKYVTLGERVKKLKAKPEKYIGDVELNKLRDDLQATTQKLNQLHLDNEQKSNKFLEDVQSYYAQQKGMSESYNGCEVKFSNEWRKLELYKNGSYYPIRNVGSKSNYMFMHLCFYLGMHQYLSSQEHSIVPNFLFIDQPSIPYYGNNRSREARAAGDLKVHVKDDEGKLKEAFRLINSFMTQNVSEENGFQIILVEHADPEYWQDLEYFETRYIFTTDKDYGLIPEYVAPLA